MEESGHHGDVDMRPGHSGAKLAFMPFVVYKSGGGVADQGEYMRSIPHCVPIYHVGRNGYLAKKLNTKIVSQFWPVAAIIDMLEDIWSIDDVHPRMWMDELFAYLYTKKSPLYAFASSACTAIEKARSCKLHGDPTWENVVWDDTTQVYKFIDALPRSGRKYKPSHPIIDIAKMAQTFCGWETFRHGWYFSKIERRYFYSWAMQQAHCERWLWFWTALNFQRIADHDYSESITNFALSRRNYLIEHQNIWPDRMES